MLLRSRCAVAVLAAVVGSFAVAGTASAEQVTVPDADASSSPSDILSVSADHAPKRVYVRISVADVDAASLGSDVAQVFYDTRKARPGPEYGVHIPVDGGASGEDCAVYRMRHWRMRGFVGRCAVSFDQGADVISTDVGRKALGRPHRVRVGVRTEHQVSGEETVDWLIGRHRFTTWLGHA